MPKKKEVVVEKDNTVKENSKLQEVVLEKVERIERLTIIIWSLSVLTFMLTIFCLFK